MTNSGRFDRLRVLPAASRADRYRPVRNSTISATAVGDEGVLYDPERGHYHSLDAAAASVWFLADGTRDVAQIARDAALTVDTVQLALAEFAGLGLLATQPPAVDRRRLLTRLAAAGIAVPIIASITAASPAAADSGACTTDGTACEPPSCSSGTAILHICENKICTDVQRNCSPYVCVSGTGCLTSCSGNSDCAAGFECIANTCQAKHP